MINAPPGAGAIKDKPWRVKVQRILVFQPPLRASPQRWTRAHCARRSSPRSQAGSWTRSAAFPVRAMPRPSRARAAWHSVTPDRPHGAYRRRALSAPPRRFPSKPPPLSTASPPATWTSMTSTCPRRQSTLATISPSRLRWRKRLGATDARWCSPRCAATKCIVAWPTRCPPARGDGTTSSWVPWRPA